MRLLNGYYIGKSGSECKYCNGDGQATCSQTCTTDSLKTAKMKLLTSTAKNMIDNALWYTYATEGEEVPQSYLQETGLISSLFGSNVNDLVNRTGIWTGIVGLVSIADKGYSNGWLDDKAWTISSSYIEGSLVWNGLERGDNLYSSYFSYSVSPSVYLKSNIQIIGGNGGSEPFKLK